VDDRVGGRGRPLARHGGVSRAGLTRRIARTSVQARAAPVARRGVPAETVDSGSGADVPVHLEHGRSRERTATGRGGRAAPAPHRDT
jgi:hypothetical protein